MSRTNSRGRVPCEGGRWAMVSMILVIYWYGRWDGRRGEGRAPVISTLNFSTLDSSAFNSSRKYP
eukprot:scaffold50660_cov69-Cyclotella_meneghiniana.AAC.1